MQLRHIVIGLSVCTGIMAVSCSAKTPDAGHGAVALKETKETPAAQPANAQKGTPDRTILFFMNPNGRPCQMQDEILSGMKEELAGLADVAYIKTTESGDREKFYARGIRGLPSLIVIDKKGTEIKRFPPGIQSKETILGALREQGEK